MQTSTDRKIIHNPNLIFMKKPLLFPVLLCGLMVVLLSCRKEPAGEDIPAEAELSFSGVKSEPGRLKNGGPLCYIETADYAKVVINGTEYYPAVYYLTINDVTRAYTQSIKLPYDPDAGNEFTVEQFLLMGDQQTPDDMSDDIIIAAIPEEGSEFAPYVTTPVDFTIVVEAFKKNEVPVQVLCFEPDMYESFGFNWFAIEEIAIMEQCFFGDICVQNPNSYIGSLYEQQAGPLQIDMPAIFRIEVYRNGYFIGDHDNEAWLGEGQPLCIRYKDYLNTPDYFDFLLYILVRKGNYFEYVLFKSWSFADGETIEDGNDNVVDFAMGPCVQNADFTLPAYMNIPDEGTCKITTCAPGSPAGGYLNAKLSGLPSGYDVENGHTATYNLDHTLAVTTGTEYAIEFYNPLYAAYGPDFLENEQWDKIHWLMNHLDWYPGHTWEDIQGALWLLDLQDPWGGAAQGGVPALSALPHAQQMKTDADAYGEGYEPSWGDQAAVILVEEGEPPSAAHPNLIVTFIELTQ